MRIRFFGVGSRGDPFSSPMFDIAWKGLGFGVFCLAICMESFSISKFRGGDTLAKALDEDLRLQDLIGVRELIAIINDID